MSPNEKNDLPEWLKWGMTIIQRLGYPIVISFIFAYLLFIQQKEQSKAISEFKEVMIQMRNSIDNMNDTNKRMIEAIYRTRQR